MLNPLSSKKELPSGVHLITTYPLPDKDTADAEHLLTELENHQCKVMSPEKLVAHIHSQMPEAYAELAFPGSGLIRATRMYVSIHHEARAFDLTDTQTRQLADTFVNLEFSHGGSIISRISSGHDTPRSPKAVLIPHNEYVSINAIHQCLTQGLEQTALFEVTQRNVPLDSHSEDNKTGQELQSSVQSNVRFKPFILQLAVYLDRLRKSLAGAAQSEVRRSILDALGLMATSDYLIDQLYSTLKQNLVEPSHQPANGPIKLNLPSVDPNILLELNHSICIRGEPGAGKTSVARKLARDALDRNLRCIYFPCSQIRHVDESLTSAMDAFLSSLCKDVPAKEARESAQLIVLDGCDEAATLRTRLSDDILQLAFKKPISIVVGKTRGHVPFIPRNLRECLEYDAASARLTMTKPLARTEYEQVMACNELSEYRAAIKKLFATMQADNPVVIATTRSTVILDAFRAFLSVRLEPFTDEQLDTFFNKWCEGTRLKADVIVRFIKDNPNIGAICRTPLIAMIVASLYENGYDLPRSKTDVYRKRFDFLLERWDAMRGVAGRNRVRTQDKMFFMERLALQMHCKHRRVFDIREARTVWDAAYAKHYGGMPVQDLLGELCSCNGLVTPEGPRHFSFGHLSFQEYLAARAIVHSQELSLLTEHYFDPWWRGVFVFYAGEAGNISRLLASLQKKHGLARHTGLLEELVKEARHTTSVVSDVIAEFANEAEESDCIKDEPEDTWEDGHRVSEVDDDN